MLTASTGKNLRRHSERQIIKTTGTLVVNKLSEQLTALLQADNLSESSINEYVDAMQSSRQFLYLNLPLLAKVLKYYDDARSLAGPSVTPGDEQMRAYAPSDYRLTGNTSDDNLDSIGTISIFSDIIITSPN